MAKKTVRKIIGVNYSPFKRLYLFTLDIVFLAFISEKSEFGNHCEIIQLFIFPLITFKKFTKYFYKEATVSLQRLQQKTSHFIMAFFFY